MGSKLYTRPKYKKNVKSTNGLLRYVHTCKILTILLSCPSPKLIAILEDNVITCLDLPLEKKSIS